MVFASEVGLIEVDFGAVDGGVGGRGGCIGVAGVFGKGTEKLVAVGLERPLLIWIHGQHISHSIPSFSETYVQPSDELARLHPSEMLVHPIAKSTFISGYRLMNLPDRQTHLGRTQQPLWEA